MEESNLQTNKDMVLCRLCKCKIGLLDDDYKKGCCSSKDSEMFEGRRLCRNCRDFVECMPGFGSRESIGNQMVMEIRRKQLSRTMPEIFLKGKKKLEEQRDSSTGEKPSSGNLISCKGEDEFDSDDSSEEESYYIPTVQGWFNLLTSSKQQEKNGDAAIMARVAHVKELEMSQPLFNIYIDGFFSIKDGGSSRQGAVLRDFHNRPIAAWSSIDSGVESTTSLHNELKGLFLGLQMAKQYQVTNFYIHCSSIMIPEILRDLLTDRNCYCGEGNSHPCRKCFLPKVWDIEETFELVLDIYPLLEQLNFSYPNVCLIDEEDNRAAYWMAELGEVRQMDMSEIKKHESLSKILYTDVFECFYL